MPVLPELSTAIIDKSSQDVYFLSHGKYQHVPKKTTAEETNRTIHEYQTPQGTFGYQIIDYITKGDTTYSKSTGYGPEASSRTWDWAAVDKL